MLLAAYSVLGLLMGCGSQAPGRPDLAEDNAAAVAAGRQLYADIGCALCHGNEGAGDGPNAVLLDPPPRDYRDPDSYKAGSSVEQIAATIGSGIESPEGGIPVYGHLSETELHLLATYVVSKQWRSAAAIDAVGAWVSEMPPTVDSAVLWLVLINRGSETVWLVGAHSDAAESVRVHRAVEAGAVVRMQPVGRLPIASGETVRFESGGLHLMLVGVRHRLVAGDNVALTLQFDDGSIERIVAPVERRE